MTTDAGGYASIDAVIPATVTFTERVNAVAIDAAGNTSQLGVWQPVQQIFTAGAPEANSDRYRIERHAGGVFSVDAQGGVLNNDLIASTANLSAVLVDPPSRSESFTLNADGSFSFEPQAGETGPLTFTYYATDGAQNSAVQTVTLDLQQSVAGLSAAQERRIDTGIGFYRGTESTGSVVAATPDGGAIVINRTSLHDGFSYNVHVRKLNASGVVTETREFAATNLAGEQQNMAVDVAADGSFAVVWQSNQDSGGTGAIFARVFDATLAPVAGETLVHADSNDSQQRPAIAALSDGRFAIAYLSDHEVAGTFEAYHLILDADGTVASGPQKLGGFVGAETSLDLVADDAGGFVLATTMAGSPGAVTHAFINSSNGRQGGQSYAAGGETDDAQAVRVVRAADGALVLTWIADGDTLKLRRIDAGGAASPPETIATFPTIVRQDIALEADGTLAIAYEISTLVGSGQGGQIHLTRVQSDGTIVAGDSLAPRYAADDSWYGGPGIAVLGGGEILLAYSGSGVGNQFNVGPTRGTFTQLFDGAAADAPATQTLSGTVRLDHDADGSTADVGSDGIQGTTVRLWKDNGDGAAGDGDLLVGSGTTGADGNYTFAGLYDGDYYVSFDSRTVTPAAGFNVGYTQDDVWAVRTVLGSAVLHVDASDDATALATTRYLTHVEIAGAGVTGIDAGFSFDAVTTTADGDDVVGSLRSVQGSLRQAITNANAIAGADATRFRLTTADAGYDGTGYQIALASALPTIDDQLLLSGTNQAGYAGTPIIQIDAAGQDEALVLVGDGSQVRGLSIGGAARVAISMEGANQRVESSWLGVGVDGTTTTTNFTGIDISGDGSVVGGVGVGNVIVSSDQTGVRVSAGTGTTIIRGNTIGLTAAGLPKANGAYGVHLQSHETVFIDDNTISNAGGAGIRAQAPSGTLTVTGNRIGTDAAGTAAAGNLARGLYVLNFDGLLRVGGTDAADRNVISANNGRGIEVDTSTLADGSFIDGNHIGLGSDGQTALGNGGDGIHVVDSSNVAIGRAGAGNLIGSNQGRGIDVHDSSDITIDANVVGLAADGTTARGNVNQGIRLTNVTDSSIGAAAAGNRIAYSTGGAILINGGSNIAIAGNVIGLDADGNAAANGGSGIILINGAAGITIGGENAADGNVVAASTGNGILGQSGSQAIVLNNRIGTDETGLLDRGNAGIGISVTDGSDGWEIGRAGAGNVIAASGSFGIEIRDVDGATVVDNRIGLGSDGQTALGNASDGIYVADSANVTIGAAGAGNVIGSSGGDGIEIARSSGVILAGNVIGLAADRVAVRSNTRHGVRVGGVTSSTIGLAGAGNLIAENLQSGILLDGSTGITIAANTIGLDGAGDAAGNGSDGVVVYRNSAGVTIGGTNAADANVISANAGHGILGQDNAQAIVVGNLIGTDATGLLSRGNGADGINLRSGSNGWEIGRIGSGNVIADNTDDGIEIHESDSITVAANIIGLGSDGRTVLANGHNGVQAELAQSLTIGSAAAGNRIAGNSGKGIQLTDVDGSTIAANTIGLDVDGNAAGNQAGGIAVLGGSSNLVIGGADTADGNVIAANSSGANRADGILVEASENGQILNNRIGTDPTGQFARGHDGHGISLTVGSHGWTIGRDGQGNLLAGNRSEITSTDSTNLSIDGNLIGVAADGQTTISSRGTAVLLFDASDSVIGTAGVGNTISGEQFGGIEVFGGDTIAIAGNRVGVSHDGTTRLFSGDEAILVKQASNVTVGGTAAGAGNVVTSDDSNAIEIQSSTGVTLRGNAIGTDATGTLDFGVLTGGGILVHGASSDITIGGAAAGAGNRIANIAGSGIVVQDLAGDRPSGVTISRNRIGSVGGSAIDLIDSADPAAPAGPNAADDDDADIGPNGLQNRPTIDAAIAYVDGTEVTFTLESTPGRTFRYEFFTVGDAAPDGAGGADSLFLTLDLPTDADGFFTATLSNLPGLPAGTVVTATVTDLTTGETSEFAGNVTVVAGNRAPVADADAYATDEDVPLAVDAASGVLAGDTDAENDDLTAVLVNGPAHAEAFTLNADGSFAYTPAADFNGTDSFTYRTFDGTDHSDPVTVSLTVDAVNDAPVADADAYTVTEDGTLTVDAAAGVLAGDTDVEGDTLRAVLVAGPANAESFTLNADGSFAYTPAADFSGADSFTYRAFDGTDFSDPATVSLTVEANNDAPVADSDAYATDEDNTLAVDAASGVLAGDTDIDGDTLTAMLVTGPAHAEAFTLNADGSFAYAPAADFNGTDSFTYRAFDGTDSSDPVTVSLTVNAVNDAPTLAAWSRGTDEDTPLPLTAADLLATAADVEGDRLQITLLSDPAHGTLEVTSSDYLYRPAADFNGTDSFTYRVSDGAANSSVVTVTLTVTSVNDAPVADADGYTIGEDGTLAVDAAAGVLAGDADIDGDALAAVLVAGPANAESFTLNADGSFSYTPTADFNGTDSFSYRAFDGTDFSDPVTVTLAVTAANDAPVAGVDAYTETEDGTLTVDAAAGVLAGDTDIDGDTLAAVLVAGPTHAESFTLNADGSFSYAPVADFNGTDSFTYRAFDGTDFSDPVTVSLTVDAVNDAPTLSDLALATDEDVPLEIPTALLLGAAGDIDGDSLTVELVGQPQLGSLVATETGYRYVPHADVNGNDRFTFRVTDGEAASEVATASITVRPVNDPPKAEDVSVALSDTVSLQISNATLLAAADDIDADALQVLLLTEPSQGTLELLPTGFRYTPAAGFWGTDEFRFQVSDGTLTSAAMTVRIDVAATAAGVAPAAAASGSSASAAPSAIRGDSSPAATASGASAAVSGPASATQPAASGSGVSAAAERSETTKTETVRREGGGTGDGDAAAVGGPVAAAGRDESEEIFAVGATSDSESEIVLAAATATASLADSASVETNLLQMARSRHLGSSSTLIAAGENVFITTDGRVLTYNEALAYEFFGGSGGYLDALERGRQQSDGDGSREQVVAGTAVAAGAAFSVGYAMWLARGGYLLAGMISALPSWHTIDPLPVLRDFSGRTDGGDESLGHILREGASNG